MKVKDLIDQLSLLPPNMEIHFEGYDDDEAIELIEDMVSVRQDISNPEINIKTEGWNLLPLNDDFPTNYQEVCD